MKNCGSKMSPKGMAKGYGKMKPAKAKSGKKTTARRK